MPDGLIYAICGALSMLPFAVWFGIQIGREQDKIDHHHDGCPLCIVNRVRDSLGTESVRRK